MDGFDVLNWCRAHPEIDEFTMKSIQVVTKINGIQKTFTLTVIEQNGESFVTNPFPEILEIPSLIRLERQRISQVPETPMLNYTGLLIEWPL